MSWEHYIHYMKRVCLESFLGLSSDCDDRIGALDMRYGPRPRASKLTASVDAFCMVLYNSVAEPLPDKSLTLQLEFGQIVFQCVSLAAKHFELRFVRLDPAKAKPLKGKKAKGQVQQLGDDSSGDFVLPSDFGENDEELVNYLQASSSFLMSMHATGAFTVLSLCLELFLLFLFGMFAFLLKQQSKMDRFTEDVSKLGRKYLPPDPTWDPV